jgi:hypothetical protein
MSKTGDIFVLSPYYIQHTATDLVSVVVKIYVYEGLEGSYTSDDLKYQKVITSLDATSVMFNVAPLIKDYLDFGIDSLNGDTIWATIIIDETTLTSSTANAYNETFLCYYSYTYFEEGSPENLSNPVILQSNTTVYLPTGFSGIIPVNERLGLTGLSSTLTGSNTLNITTDTRGITNLPYSSDTTTLSFTYNSVSYPITLKVIDECKETPYKVRFINKFGAIQDLFFFKKSVLSIDTEKSEYRANILGDSTIYDTTKHQYKTFNKSGKQKITLNSGFVGEEMNEVFRQLMLSEKVWIDYEGDTLPINISNQNMTFKTRLNDKLINYTIDAEFAFDKINTVN